MPKNNFVPAVIVLAAVCLSCTFFKGGSNSSPYGIGDISKSPVSSVDPNAPFPEMSTDVIDALITELPELGKHRGHILEAEREAINGLLSGIRANSQAANANALMISPLTHLPSPYQKRVESDAPSTAGYINLIPAAYAAGEPPEIPDMGGIQPYLIGYQIGYFMVASGDVSEADRGKSKTVEMKDETTGTVQASMVLSVSKDGSVSTELSTSISMPIFLLNANSKVKLTGNICPDPNGKVDLTIEHSSNGRAGSSGSVIYDKNRSAKIKATVDDNAEVASIDLDMKQGTRSTAGGRQVYVETSQTGRGTTGDHKDISFGGPRVDRASSQATADDAALSQKGLSDAYLLALGTLESAKSRWQGGGCVKIEATSPGSVAVNSSTQIPVKVLHKSDGTEVPSKLNAELSGAASVDPTVIPRTAGTLKYVAPGERGKSATIKLTANSRRGRATLDLTATTGSNSYRVAGTSNGVSFTGEICGLDKQFTIDGKFPGGSAVTTFSPGGPTAGTTKPSGGGSGCKHSGGGNYSVTLNEDGSGTITWTTTDTIACPGFNNTRTVTFTLPLTPAPELSCP